MSNDTVPGDAPKGEHTGKVAAVSPPPAGQDTKPLALHVPVGGGAVMTVPNPRGDPHAEWVMRYGNAVDVRYVIAEMLASYAYLLSPHVTAKEAVRRLRLMRSATGEQ